MLLPLKIKDAKCITWIGRKQQWFVKETISLLVPCLSAQIHNKLQRLIFLFKKKQNVLINSEILFFFLISLQATEKSALKNVQKR